MASRDLIKLFKNLHNADTQHHIDMGCRALNVELTERPIGYASVLICRYCLSLKVLCRSVVPCPFRVFRNALGYIRVEVEMLEASQRCVRSAACC